MRFKLDENLDVRLVPLVAEGGHDVATIHQENLTGSDDGRIYEACVQERRILVTLDLDFANPVRFPPAPTDGIVVIRSPRPALTLIRATLESALPTLKSRDLKGALWIVEPGRIRTYEPEREERDSP